MPRALTDNGRVELRLRPEDKATLTRAASLKRLDLTGYILGAALPKAEADIAELRSSQPTVEVPQVQRVGYDRRERCTGRVVPEFDFSARLQASGRKGLKLRHAPAPS